MIDEIQVRNLALISRASLEPARGMTVLTGETGAGKTALISALKLLMGDRADKSAIRDGEDELQVSGRFYFGGGEQDALRELVATRRLSSDGRSRVSLDGEMASVGSLAAQVAPSIDLCGQNEHQQLTKPATHAALLDSWIGVPAQEALSAYAKAFDDALEAQSELERILSAKNADAERIEQARFIHQRIQSVDPQPGEYDQLAADLQRAEHGEALALAVNRAYEQLSDEGGALDAVNAAIAAIGEGCRYDRELEPLAKSLHEACYLLEDTAAEARRYRDKVDFDPQVLAESQERMAAIQGLMRVYGPRLEDVLEARDRAAELLDMTDGREDLEDRARRAAEKASEQLRQAGEVLAAVRGSRAGEFAESVCAQMARMEMGSARIDCRLDMLPFESWTSSGPQAVEFMFRPGAGMQPRPLAKIASGGEISRVMLAIKAVLGKSDNVDTLVFDEVDAGTGGATATALGEVLHGLSESHQVIVVTHLAQVAAYADAHYVVRKSGGDVPQTTLAQVEGEERVREIARMLSGEQTELSLAHAQELLSRA